MSTLREQRDVHDRLIGRTIARWLEDRDAERARYDAPKSTAASPLPPEPLDLAFRPSGPVGANRIATGRIKGRTKFRGKKG